MSIHGRQDFGSNVENKLDDIWKQLIFFKLSLSIDISWQKMQKDPKKKAFECNRKWVKTKLCFGVSGPKKKRNQWFSVETWSVNGILYIGKLSVEIGSVVVEKKGFNNQEYSMSKNKPFLTVSFSNQINAADLSQTQGLLKNLNLLTPTLAGVNGPVKNEKLYVEHREKPLSIALLKYKINLFQTG